MVAGRGVRVAALGMLLGMPSSGHALALDVPGTHATLQAAVAAAALSVDVDNVITISVSPVTTSAAVDIGAAFGPARRLVIRPADGLDRASVVSNAPLDPVLSVTSAGNVTIQGLDLLRNVTNASHLVTLSTCEDVTIERCRIGTNSPTPGIQGLSNVLITYPTNVTLKNNILFARTLGVFDHAIHAHSFNDPANSLRLYNNVASDYRVYGILIHAAIAGPLVLLRNNVAVNHASLAAEPAAYRTEVAAAGPTVVTSHNVAFATGGLEETAAFGSQTILGAAPPSLVLPKASAAPAFVALAWATAPPYDDNADFYRLVPGGPLHVDAGQYGFTATDLFPDVAVLDDIERDPRPTGASPHTDRGADQIELTSRVSVVPAGSPQRLAVMPRQNPAGALALVYSAGVAGRLSWEVFDPMGRRLGSGERQAAEGSRGVIPWAGARDLAAGVLLYRVRLEPTSGPAEERTGRAVLVR